MYRSPRSVKVLCTLGPASLNAATIHRLEERGVDLFRINLSHTPLENVATTVELIQKYSTVPVCLDTEGAQVRTGQMAKDVRVSEAQHVHLTPRAVEGTATEITLTPGTVFEELQPNHIVGLDFDGVMLLVLNKNGEGVDTVVINGGNIGTNKAVIISPAVRLEAITDKDRAAVAIGRQLGVKHFALSFTNSADDVTQLRELTGPDSVIISKIESKRGVINLDEILAAADEILIDRGDLSREVPLENIPLLQKSIVRKANHARVPVNVATNLLESMITNRKPTRAELNDIVNTLLDGATGLVLAAETAVGQHPVGAVDMVLNLIDRVRDASEGYRIEDLTVGSPSLLPPLHGQQSMEGWPSRRQRTPSRIVQRLPAIEVGPETILDIENLSNAVYSPLRGFMTEAELNSVLNSNRLPNGAAWTMPIILQGKSQEFAAFQAGQAVRLIDTRNGSNLAVLQIEDKFEISRESIAERWFGTTDKRHPGVRRFAAGGLTLLGGPIEKLQSSAARSPFELTPAQTRMIFDVKGWSKIVAHHVESAPHLAHEHIIGRACERSRADGILIHPAIGVKRAGELSTEVILGTFERLVQLAFPHALFAAFGTYARFAGPRETVFHALCRKNFGCTHFIVANEAGGLSEWYSPEATRELFQSLGDIGITPVYFDKVYFSETDGGTVEGPWNAGGLQELSDARIHEFLAADEAIPATYMRSEVAQWLADHQRNGIPLFSHTE